MAYMSQEGYDKLVEDLRQMENVERPRITAMIADARDKGDLSENAEYDAAKDAQGLLEIKIGNIKKLLAEAKILDKDKLQTKTVQVFNKVTLRDANTGVGMTYTLVPENEANIREKRISVSAPIAKGLLGKKVGDLAEITVPKGVMTFEIMEITL